MERWVGPMSKGKVVALFASEPREETKEGTGGERTRDLLRQKLKKREEEISKLEILWKEKEQEFSSFNCKLMDKELEIQSQHFRIRDLEDKLTQSSEDSRDQIKDCQDAMQSLREEHLQGENQLIHAVALKEAYINELQVNLMRVQKEQGELHQALANKDQEILSLGGKIQKIEDALETQTDLAVSSQARRESLEREIADNAQNFRWAVQEAARKQEQWQKREAELSAALRSTDERLEAQIQQHQAILQVWREEQAAQEEARVRERNEQEQALQRQQEQKGEDTHALLSEFERERLRWSQELGELRAVMQAQEMDAEVQEAALREILDDEKARASRATQGLQAASARFEEERNRFARLLGEAKAVQAQLQSCLEADRRERERLHERVLYLETENKQTRKKKSELKKYFLQILETRKQQYLEGLEKLRIAYVDKLNQLKHQFIEQSRALKAVREELDSINVEVHRSQRESTETKLSFPASLLSKV